MAPMDLGHVVENLVNVLALGGRNVLARTGHGYSTHASKAQVREAAIGAGKAGKRHAFHPRNQHIRRNIAIHLGELI